MKNILAKYELNVKNDWLIVELGSAMSAVALVLINQYRL